MNDALDRPLTAEEIRVIAQAQVGLTLSDREIEALRPLLNSLRDEIKSITPPERSGATPAVTFELEPWDR
jgi:hypothetical protein